MPEIAIPMLFVKPVTDLTSHCSEQGSLRMNQVDTIGALEFD